MIKSQRRDLRNFKTHRRKALLAEKRQRFLDGKEQFRKDLLDLERGFEELQQMDFTPLQNDIQSLLETVRNERDRSLVRFCGSGTRKVKRVTAPPRESLVDSTYTPPKPKPAKVISINRPLKPSPRHPRPATQEDRETPEYRKWRTAVLENASEFCEVCGTQDESLEAHHLLPFSTHPDDRLDEYNGMCLCKSCHKALHHKVGLEPCDRETVHDILEDYYHDKFTQAQVSRRRF